MHRSIKTVNRPDPHIIDPDPLIPPDHKGRRFCRCALREDDSVHVSAADLVADLEPNPIAEDDRRIIGEG